MQDPTALASAAHTRTFRTILYSLIVSKSVPELTERMGGRAIRTRAGHSFIK